MPITLPCERRREAADLSTTLHVLFKMNGSSPHSQRCYLWLMSDGLLLSECSFQVQAEGLISIRWQSGHVCMDMWRHSNVHMCDPLLITVPAMQEDNSAMPWSYLDGQKVRWLLQSVSCLTAEMEKCIAFIKWLWAAFLVYTKQCWIPVNSCLVFQCVCMPVCTAPNIVPRFWCVPSFSFCFSTCHTFYSHD